MGGAVALSAGIAPAHALTAPALIGLKDLDARTLSFDCIQTGEKLKSVTYWAKGRYEPGALDAINHSLRDFQNGDVHPIDPKVLDVLHRIGQALDTADVMISSVPLRGSCRLPAKNGSHTWST